MIWVSSVDFWSSVEVSHLVTNSDLWVEPGLIGVRSEQSHAGFLCSNGQLFPSQSISAVVLLVDLHFALAYIMMGTEDSSKESSTQDVMSESLIGQSDTKWLMSISAVVLLVDLHFALAYIMMGTEDSSKESSTQYVMSELLIGQSDTKWLKRAEETTDPCATPASLAGIQKVSFVGRDAFLWRRYATSHLTKLCRSREQ